MTKDDLMQMARDADACMSGTVHISHGGSAFGTEQLKAFANAVLERSAVECEDTDIEEARGGTSYYAQLGDAVATKYSIASAIRALKIQEGE